MSDIQGGKIIYEIAVETSKNAENSISQTEKALNKLGKEVEATDKKAKEASKNNGGFSSLKGSLTDVKNVIAGISFVALAQGAYNFFKTSVQGALESQLATEKLANAIKNVSSAREGDIELLLDQASALEKTTTFTKESILQSQQLLATYQLNGREIEQLTPRLLDMAASLAGVGATTSDLDALSQSLGKALTNGASSLKRYGVTMSEAQQSAYDMATGMEKIRILGEILDQNYKGQAETVGKTYAGQIVRATNRLANMKDTIGFALLPALKSMGSEFLDGVDIMEISGEGFNNLSRTVYGAAKVIQGFIGVQIALYKTLKTVGTAVFLFGDSLVKLFEGIKEGDFSKFSESINTFTTSISEDGVSALESFKNSLGDIKEAYSQTEFKAITEDDISQYKSLTQANKDLASSVGQTGTAIQDQKDAVDQANKSLEDFQKKLISSKEEATKTSDSLKKDLTESFKKFSDELSNDVKDGSKKLAEIVVDAEQKKKEIQDKISNGGGDTEQLKKELAEAQSILDARVGYEERARAKIDELKKKVTDAGLDPTALNLDTLKTQADLETQIKKERENAKLNEFQLFEQEQNDKIAKLTETFIAEVSIIQQKYEKSKQYEQELTNFISSENIKRSQDIQNFADKAIKKYGDMANSLKQVLSLQSQIKLSSGTGLPQFHDGGYVGASGGEVHAGEFVIPQPMVQQMPDLISQLEKMRGTNQTNNITINSANTQNSDLKTLSEEMLWKLGRM